MTPSEIRIWEATYAAFWAGSSGWDDPVFKAECAIHDANAAVRALRGYRAKHGVRVGIELPELPAKVAE